MNSCAAAPADGTFTTVAESATTAAAATRLTILLKLLEPMTALLPCCPHSVESREVNSAHRSRRSFCAPRQYLSGRAGCRPAGDHLAGVDQRRSRPPWRGGRPCSRFVLL